MINSSNSTFTLSLSQQWEASHQQKADTGVKINKKINNIDHLLQGFCVKQTFIFMAEAILPLQTSIFKHFQWFGKNLPEMINFIDFSLCVVKISLPLYSSSFTA